MLSPLKQARIERQLSQWHVAKETGVAQSLLSLYERNLLDPSENAKEALCAFFSMPEQELFATRNGESVTQMRFMIFERDQMGSPDGLYVHRFRAGKSYQITQSLLKVCASDLKIGIVQAVPTRKTLFYFPEQKPAYRRLDDEEWAEIAAQFPEISKEIEPQKTMKRGS